MGKFTQEGVSNVETAERFGYEWQKYSDIIPEYEAQFRKWVQLPPKFFKGKKVLDAGCGNGRNSFWALKYGAEEVVAFDYDERTVAAAAKNLKEFPNAKVFYASIYNLPELSGKPEAKTIAELRPAKRGLRGHFDVAMSIGVIEHLEYPEIALSKLTSTVKQGGKVIIWVMGHEGNEGIIRLVTTLRLFTKWLPLWLVNVITYFFSVPLYVFLKFPQKNPYLQQIMEFRFWHVHSIILDQLIPKVSKYYRKEELEELMKQGMKDVKLYRVNEKSWTAVGTRDKNVLTL